MRNRYPRSSLPARLSLLIAALLYLVGATADPLVHFHEIVASGAESVWEHGAEDGSHDTESPASHGEFDCFFCKAIGGATPAEPGLLTIVELARSAGVPVLVSRGYSSFSHSPSQPRAPPLS